MTPHERALIAEYEAVLVREGLGVIDEREFRHPPHVNGGTNVYQRARNVPYVPGTILANVAAKAQFWSLVAKGVSELPRNYPHRSFLTKLAESGNLLGTCREYGITRDKGRWAFRTFLRAIGLGASRPARI